MLAQAREEYARLHYEDLRVSRSEGLEEGFQKGREEGRDEGLQRGEAGSLLRMLAKRFGPVPDDTRELVESATLEEIRGWLDRILDVDSLDDLFRGK